MSSIHRRVVAALAALGTTAALSAGVATSTAADAAPAPTVNAQDQAFLVAAAQANLAEVELGKLAKKQSDRRAVQQFGRDMIKDHRQQYAALQAVATSVGVALPTRPNREQRRIAKAWSSTSGTDFDCAYVPFQWDDHQGVILLHQLEVASGSDPQVKAAATAALPVLQEHFTHAAMLLGKLKRC